MADTLSRIRQFRRLLTGTGEVGTTNPLPVNQVNPDGSASLAVTTARLLSAAASTNDTNVKATPGVLYAIQGYNARASAVYLKLYNKATTPTVGTDVPVKTLYLPASSAFAFDWPSGYSFATGIGYGLTTAGADNSTAAVTAADILALNLDYA